MHVKKDILQCGDKKDKKFDWKIFAHILFVKTIVATKVKCASKTTFY